MVQTDQHWKPDRKSFLIRKDLHSFSAPFDPNVANVRLRAIIQITFSLEELTRAISGDRGPLTIRKSG